MVADAACMHEMMPVAENEIGDVTLGEIVTEFATEPADAARMDMSECDVWEGSGEEGDGEEGDGDDSE